MGLFDEIKGELEAFSCSKKLNWPKSDTAGGGVPWRNAESGGVLRAIGSVRFILNAYCDKINFLISC